ncbi:MAG TPA: hypothetical protein VFQ41_24595 [Candidatus Angelobacter sp.]|nr:hypothetical protein [Candidatus Angelobacter sp.]
MNTDDTDQEKANYYRGLARMGADQEIARIAKITEIENRKRKRTERVDLMAVLLRWAFIVAPLRCATGLRRKEEIFFCLYGTTPQPLLATLASGITLKSCPDTCLSGGCGIVHYEENQMWCGRRCGIPPFAKAAKGGAPTVW